MQLKTDRRSLMLGLLAGSAAMTQRSAQAQTEYQTEAQTQTARPAATPARVNSADWSAPLMTPRLGAKRLKRIIELVWNIQSVKSVQPLVDAIAT